jgi:hypothetical protein
MIHDKTILARMAGFVNGEGCFHSNQGKYASLIISQDTDTEDLELFVKYFGGKIYGPYKERGKECMYYYKLQVLEKVDYLYKCLYPWLSRVKRDQGEYILEIAYDHRASIDWKK